MLRPPVLSTATRSRQSTNAGNSCTGTNHKASESRCPSTCKFCNRRHLSSICDKEPQQPGHMLVATERGSVTYPESYQVRQHDPGRRPYVYCEISDHQSVNCDKVTTIHEHRKQLNLKQLCFNCTGANHKAGFATEETPPQFAIRNLNSLNTCWWPLEEALSHIRRSW